MSTRFGQKHQLTIQIQPRQEKQQIIQEIALTPASNSNPAALSPLVNFSDLQRISRIGTDGNIYKALHRPTGDLYALRVFHQHSDDSVNRSIKRQIELLRDVDHPNVVKCHGLFDRDGEFHVLLEHVDGASLESVHMPDEAFLAGLARQLLSGLSYLHGRKLVHRDLKPSNILINSKGEVKIADMGFLSIKSMTHTQTMVPSTIAYMSPERINTDTCGGLYNGYAGDVWSFGLSYLEIFTGSFPLAVAVQGDWASLVSAICESEVPEAPLSASPEFRDFIGGCLSRDPAKRWTADQLLNHPFILDNTSGNKQQW
ncbi:hypothetical protein RJ639_019462 [Escallonia herrerae]|uniref:Protein kinase domain-containing protein n=1 Tax=Escallonia herrerae TaxID=1293975 RepID=A0AA88V9V6_9ASTE|nr:hypothetical protein RJ639_019462 [Escallonia herrerae]